MDDLTTEDTTEGFGLMFYNARWYDPYNTHFTSPDTIIPDNYNTLDWDRYAYSRSNPIKYNDPTGHKVACGVSGEECESDRPSSKPSSKYTVGVKIKLTKEEAADLLIEINWALDNYLEPLNDTLSSPLAYAVDLTGGASVVALLTAPANPLVATTAVIGGATFAVNTALSNTIGDMQDVRYEVAMASNGGEQGVDIDMGQDVGSWGISVNDKDVVKHTELGQFHPIGALLTPKGTITATKVWFTAWYLFDYGK